MNRKKYIGFFAGLAIAFGLVSVAGITNPILGFLMGVCCTTIGLIIADIYS